MDFCKGMIQMGSTFSFFERIADVGLLQVVGKASSLNNITMQVNHMNDLQPQLTVFTGFNPLNVST